MDKNQSYRTGRHCFFDVRAHLVFLTKYRENVLDDDAIYQLRDMFDKVCRDFETTLIGLDGEEDYVHLLVTYPPKIAVSSLVNSLKGVSSRLLRQTRRDLEKYYDQGGLWSPSYAVISYGDASVQSVQNYIESQRINDSGE